MGINQSVLTNPAFGQFQFLSALPLIVSCEDIDLPVFLHLEARL
jgi:hypothetical protein